MPPGVATLRDSYTIYYGFDQYVKVFPGERRTAAPVKPPRGWGFFGRFSVSDGNPTPFNYFLSAGIGGDSRLGEAWLPLPNSSCCVNERVSRRRQTERVLHQSVLCYGRSLNRFPVTCAVVCARSLGAVGRKFWT
ncbi:MAG TPA: hypothetical protein EYQ63_11510 [Fuerstia sp.]|nr:hypothetical protein [Fuerstiella sp.]